ncbi:MAG: mannitol dehydrogenase [Oscillospiraceae bacterium]|nr:mannitol dehydrogenase [Oscillospiraceae bacterium]MBR2081327.1 mannitol dehydrogenase [Oscillospiraceae bacterium]MBR2977098.1 mannitol dehydrogenase [Oscillospiraceae bacterium]
MKAVMYGGGNIGRGFIGLLMSSSGYEVTFIDVAEPVVAALREKNSYPVRYISGDTYEDVLITNVTAVNGNDAEAASEAIASCDLMATAVGARILPYIVPNIVAGLRKRWERGGKLLNIIICENLNDAADIFTDMLKQQLNEKEQKLFDETVGMVEASIGRMIPVQTDAMKDGEPMRICTERYGFLPVDKAAFKGELPKLKNMVPYEPFDFFVKRKLFVHNLGHATCAYLGGCFGLSYIYEAIDDPNIRIIVQNAMLESASALSEKYGADLAQLQLHITDLLHRFTNSALGDTCARVGQDPRRKLAPSDRLIGSSTLMMQQGKTPAYITLGAAAAVCRCIDETEGAEQGIDTAKAVLRDVSGLAENDPLTEMILSYYQMLLDGASLETLRRTADARKSASLSDVI